MNILPGNNGSILNESYDLIRFSLGDSFDEIYLDRVVLGLFFTGVKLSNEIGGICFTPIKSIPEAVCCPSSASAMPNSGKFHGKKVSLILDDLFSQNPLKKTIAIAVLNALSETCRKAGFYKDYRYITGADPMDFFDIAEGSYTVVIGALLPYIRMLKKKFLPYGILELDPRTLRDEELSHYISPENTNDALSKADYLLITGTTLINDTLEEILAHRKEHSQAIVVGPTASLYPDPLFQRGVVSLGGISITDPDGMLDIISQAGSGYHFYGKYAEKTVITKRN